MKVQIIICILSVLLPNISLSQKDYPISVNGIEIGKYIDTGIVSNCEMISITDSFSPVYPYFKMYSSEFDQMVVLFTQPGAIINSFQEVIIKQNLIDSLKQEIKEGFCITKNKHFETNSGISLGLTKEELNKKVNLKNFDFKQLDNNQILYSYITEDSSIIPTLSEYNLSGYYCDFLFCNNKLIEIKFGFVAP